MRSYDKKIKIAARDSKLSIAQVEEVKKLLGSFYADLEFQEVFVKAYGDIDLKTSLRKMGKSDFFTKEVDELLLNHSCDMAIHSAKDLPEILPEGLTIAAITKGVDSSDSLVLREGENFETLKKGAIIGASCLRREEMVRLLREDFAFADIRGPVDSRIKQLYAGKYDGIVVAEAALIRLNLTHLNRIKLKGDTTPFQGRLAITIRKTDITLKNLLSALHYEEAALFGS